MKCTYSSVGWIKGRGAKRLICALRSTAAAIGIMLFLMIPVRTLASALVPGDIYVYTSPGVLTDVTAEYHEDPVLLICGQQVQIYPDYTNGYVYDAYGDVLGFICGAAQQLPPS